MSNRPSEQLGRRIRRLDLPATHTQRIWWRSPWVASVSLALLIAALVLLWSWTQVTQQSHADQVLRATLVPLTEVDTLVAREHAALVDEASRSRGRSIAVPHFPLTVQIPAAELEEMSAEELRARILADSARQIYADGAEVFDRGGADGGGGFLSAQRWLRFTLNRLTEGQSQLATVMAAFGAAATLVALWWLLRMTRSWGRLRAAGIAVAAGGALALLAAVAMRLAIDAAAGRTDDPFSASLLELGADMTGIPLRNAVIFLVVGVLIAAAAIGAANWEKEHKQRPSQSGDLSASR